MNGEQFLALAAELISGPTESHYRSAVSRAYYGAFHVARRLLEDVGVHLPKGEQVHAKATYCLQDCGEQVAGEAADDLETLRNERNRADYDLDRIVYQQRVAEMQVRKAQQIAAKLQQCRSGPNAADFRAKVRAHAKLLGLPVSQ
jgi:uncharacterized protein (UPF0332 family)